MKNLRLSSLACLFVLAISNNITAQVGVGTTTPETTMDIRSTNHLGGVTSTDGILVPRVNDLNTAGTVNGQLVYLISNSGTYIAGFHYWDGSQWTAVVGWNITGNSGTINGTHFLGTIDAQDIDIRTNNVIHHRFTQQGQLEFLNTGRSTFLGENAGANDDLSNNSNTFVGYNAGAANTNGAFNNFFGNDSGQANTTGFQNNFFGNNSGRENTTGDFNSFYGHGSGRENTTGSQNSFFGQSSGEDNTTGISNSFFGESSGSSNTTGRENSFFGRNSGRANTTANFNSFFGDGSGVENTTGSLNSFFGESSGLDNTSGRQNSFFGQGSGSVNTTGNFNSFFGQNSGRANITGNQNSFFGQNSGSFNEGSGNVFIGYSAGSNETTGSNLLYIENSSSSTPLIWGDFSTNRLGINRVATTNTLEVGGEASKATAGNWLANSDSRLKKNLRPLDPNKMLQQMLSLNGITYEWNDTTTGNPRPTGIQYGFTAQNIQEVFPTLVTEDAKGYLQTAYGTYDAMTVESIRALHNRIKALEKENKALRTEMDTRVEAIEKWVSQQSEITPLTPNSANDQTISEK